MVVSNLFQEVRCAVVSCRTRYLESLFENYDKGSFLKFILSEICSQIRVLVLSLKVSFRKLRKSLELKVIAGRLDSASTEVAKDCPQPQFLIL